LRFGLHDRRGWNEAGTDISILTTLGKEELQGRKKEISRRGGFRQRRQNHYLHTEGDGTLRGSISRANSRSLTESATLVIQTLYKAKEGDD